MTFSSFFSVNCSINEFWRFGFEGFFFFLSFFLSLIVVDLDVDGRKDAGSVIPLQKWKL